MRKWLLIFILAALFVSPSLAFAQTDLTLVSVDVQLWPEYDRERQMLVIVDYAAPTDIKLPVDLTFHIPKDAELIAVANYSTDGTSLINAVFNPPTADGDWLVFTATLDSMMGHFEYYQPITFNGDQRDFSYLWDEKYAVNSFTVRLLEPLDTTALTTNPKLDLASQRDGLNYYSGNPVKIEAGKQFALNVKYKKSSDALVASSQPVQPAAPLDENTTGRISFSNYLPYILGGVGLLLVIGGVGYFLQAGRYTGTKKSRRRARGRSNEEEDGSDVYCAQCGSRARDGDRFCRTCGSRIRQQED